MIAGVARGRRLAVPAGRATRPTSDRAREALFSTLESIRGPLPGCHFLDLYAGSGAVGIEAASRGAADVLLIESDPRAGRVARANIDVVGLPGVRLVQAAVQPLLSGPPPADSGPFDVVFADPPYSVDHDVLAEVARSLAGQGWLAPGAVVVIERPSRAAGFVWPDGFAADRFRRYGEATLWYGRAAR